MLDRLLSAGRALLGLGQEAQAPGPAPEPAAAPAPITRRVLMIVHDPPVESAGGRRLTELFGWHRPDDLARAFIDDLREASHGYLRYQIAERIAADWYPAKVDGFRYSSESFLAAWRARAMRQPHQIDYHAQIAAFDLIGRYNRREFDEVWFFSFPYAGDYESTMVGRGAFWCNSPPVEHGAGCDGKFVIMTFNYERDVGCMLESYGHRAESIMQRVYERLARGPNMWELFCRYDQVAPGQAHCGNVHFAPNSARDYDWGNRRRVLSFCDDWYSYPQLPGQARAVSCAEWGGGDMRAHHMWWFRHLPHVAGSSGGVENNWWRYIADPNLVP